MNIENLHINGFYILSVSIVWILGLVIGMRVGKSSKKQMIIHNPYAKKGVMEAEKDDVVDHTGTIIVNVIEEESFSNLDMEAIADFTFNLTTEEMKKRKDNPLNKAGNKPAKEIIDKEKLIDINQIRENDENSN